MKTANLQLQEMARTILAELDRAVFPQGLTETELDDAAEKVERRENLNANSQLVRYRALRALENSGGNGTVLAAMSAPRMTRRAFLAQRIERRESRNADEGGEDADGETFATDLRRDELTDAGTPAQLSEIYRRDARRYDGPFERY